MRAGTLQALYEDWRWEDRIGQVGADGCPFVADGEGAVDELADEGLGVGCYGDDDGLGHGLREGLVDELADGFAFEADAAVGCVAVDLRGGHVVHEHARMYVSIMSVDAVYFD